MVFFSHLQDFLKGRDERTLRMYVFGFFAGVTLLIGGGWFYTYRTVQTLKKRIRTINELREQAKEILDKSKQVELQRSYVNTMLAQNPNFKIAGYFTELLKQLGLSDKSVIETPVSIDLDNEYTESSLKVTLTNMNMKELTQLLTEIQQTPRVYTKSLEIMRSPKTPNSIDTTLTIATLRPKLETE